VRSQGIRSIVLGHDALWQLIELAHAHSRKAALILFVCAATLGFSTVRAATAQDISQVHIYPRVRGIDSPSPHDTNANLILKSRADLVLVPAMVTDSMDRLVTGLEKSNFEIYQDKQRQTISNLSSEDVPVSIGVILDTSGSMGNKMDKALDAVTSFLDNANLRDEFFLISFSDEPHLISGFTNRVSDIKNKMPFLRSKGRTSLLDAIYVGINELRNAAFQRKALLIISDGGDNHSRYTEGEVKPLAREADAQIFAIGIFDRYPSSTEEINGPELLSEISDVTGGRTFTIDNPNDLADVARKVADALRDEYVLAYVPRPAPLDGKWHKIKVKLLPPKGMPWLSVSWKRGYYAAFQ
jgi:Ca-activated chloride channel homolog